MSGDDVYCWGAGYQGGVGRLGCTSTTTPCAPGIVPGVTATAVKVNQLTSCAITTTQQVACWGVLGVDTSSGAWITSTSPVVLDSIAGATALAGGGDSFCALAGGGTVWCWGDNSERQLGDGDSTHQNVPRQVAGAPALTVLDGDGRTYCGLDAAGGAWCWGLAGYTGWNASLTNTTPCRWTATLCRTGPTHLAPTVTFTTLSVGGLFVCGMATDGLAYCWGGDPLIGAPWGDDVRRAPGQRP